MSGVRVYFEKQGSDRLCGVHCLNSLLQGPVFTQADLNKFASDLDKEESALLAADPNKPKPPRSMTISSLSNRPQSHNVDDTGNFSLGVLEKALGSKYGIQVQNAARRESIQQINREGLLSHEGFVVHLRDHWFSARAVPTPTGDREWYFLDSLKDGPTKVSENELWGTLQGIIQSGGFVFVLSGAKLPNPMLPSKPVLKSHQYYGTADETRKRLSSDISGGATFTVTDPKARQQVTTDWSKLGSGNTVKSSSTPVTEPVDDDLRTAIAASMKDMVRTAPKPEPVDGGPITTLMVRLPSGQRHVRKFATETDTVGDVFVWLDFVAQIFPTEYSLVGTLDMRGWKLTRSTLTRVGGSGPVHITPDTTLSAAGIRSGQESFNLQL